MWVWFWILSIHLAGWYQLIVTHEVSKLIDTAPIWLTWNIEFTCSSSGSMVIPWFEKTLTQKFGVLRRHPKSLLGPVRLLLAKQPLKLIPWITLLPKIYVTIGAKTRHVRTLTEIHFIAQLIATLNNYACSLPPLANVDWSAFPECFLLTM